MKTTRTLWIALGLALGACSGAGTGGDEGGITELALRRTVTGTIGTVGEVDWYHYRAVEANNVLRIRCTSETLRPDVDLAVAVYEGDGRGGRVRLYGDHAPEGSQLPADIEMNVYVDAPKDLYIAVRDLMDDEASDRPYHLTIDFPGSAGDDGSFASAVPLQAVPGAEPVEDTIGYVGDVDCYTFTAAADGVYAVDVAFSPFPGGTGVELAVEVFDAGGERVIAYTGPQRLRYRLVPYLEAGTYYVLVQDFGRDDADEASPYRISVTPVEAAEALEDDGPASARALAYDPGAGAYTARGALEYQGDEDWYALPDPDDGTGIPVLEVVLDDGGGAPGFRYSLELLDEAGLVLLAHEHLGGSAPYRTQIRAGRGVHRVRVRPAPGQDVSDPAPYALTVTVASVDDPDEADPGNDTIGTALALEPGREREALIAYRGDEDWYAVGTDTSAWRVLEVFLETDGPTRADPALSVIGDGLLARVEDPYGGDGPTRLKTSLLLPAADPADAVTYFLRVADAQGDEGEPDLPYRIRCNLREVPAGLPPDPQAPDAVYYGEVAEALDASAAPVRLEVNAVTHRRFAANTTLLRFNGPDPAPGITRTTADGVTTIRMPWIGGYIDYRGDQDWFALELGPLDDGVTPPASSWYYDIRIELHVGEPGSDVEYVWKLYRDPNGNGILVDRPGDSNGFFASAGDPDTEPAPLDVTAPDPEGGEPFWVGDAWEGTFYLSVGDFDYVASDLPDDDWGYDGAPYHLRVTLIYHPGVSRP